MQPNFEAACVTEIARPAVVEAATVRHPGEILRREILPERQLSVSETATAIGISRQMLSKVLNGRAAISPALALRLARFLGVAADELLHRQSAYDLTVTARRMAAELARIPVARQA